MLKKYISDGNIFILKRSFKNSLIFSKYRDNKIPEKTPINVPKIPIIDPVKIKIFNIEFFVNPIDLKIEISLHLFLINMVKTDIMLKAATTIIRDSIINITFRSNFKASKKVLLLSIHEKTKFLL